MIPSEPWLYLPYDSHFSSEPNDSKRCSKTSSWGLIPLRCIRNVLNLETSENGARKESKTLFIHSFKKLRLSGDGKRTFYGDGLAFFYHNHNVCKFCKYYHHFYFVSLSFIHARRAIDHSFNAIYATKSSILKINVIDIKFKRRKPLKGPIAKFACVPLDHNWVPSSDWKSFFMFTKRLEIFFFTDILSNLL